MRAPAASRCMPEDAAAAAAMALGQGPEGGKERACEDEEDAMRLRKNHHLSQPFSHPPHLPSLSSSLPLTLLVPPSRTSSGCA
jgi:hypothetical protein